VVQCSKDFFFPRCHFSNPSTHSFDLHAMLVSFVVHTPQTLVLPDKVGPKQKPFLCSLKCEVLTFFFPHLKYTRFLCDHGKEYRLELPLNFHTPLMHYGTPLIFLKIRPVHFLNHGVLYFFFLLFAPRLREHP